MTYTHHFILQSVDQNGLVVKDVLDNIWHDYVLTSDVKQVEDHWSIQNGVSMICVNVYVTEDV